MQNTALGVLEGRHAGQVAHIFGNGPSLLGLSKTFWRNAAGSLTIAHNDSIFLLEKCAYWFISDQTTVTRCRKVIHRANTVLAANHLKLPVDESRVVRWMPASFDTLLTNKAPGKYVAGLFSGPVACCWIAWRMGCKAAWMYGCDGYALHETGRKRFLWHAVRGGVQDWIPEQQIGRHLTRGVRLRSTKIGTWNVMFPKHQRYGCGFFEMDKFLHGKIQVWNDNPWSIYAPQHKRSPLHDGD